MKPITILLTILLFGAFGYIGAYQKGNEWILIAISAGAGIIEVAMLYVLLRSVNNITKEKPQLANEAILQGLAFMIPFALLALLADRVLGWQSAQAFFAAGLTALAISGGAVMLKNGSRRWGAVYMPMIWAMVCSTGWIILLALFK